MNPQRSPINTISIIILALLGFAAVTVIPGVFWYRTSLQPLGGDKPYIFTVDRGQGAGSIAVSLKERKIIRSSLAFRILARRLGVESALQAGTYRLNSQQDARTILDTLREGRVADVRITIPEGLTSQQIASILHDKGVLPDTEGFLKTVRMNGLEGKLFPETYSIPLGTDYKAIVEMMTDRFASEVTSILGRDALMAPGFPNVLILASLVEREAQAREDRPLVASVFSNRLKAGKRLESCATIQYILGRPKARLLYGDLKRESPYNTYLHKGLPPTPICNPGLDAIRAAAHPPVTKYYYFVLGKNGRHVFSRDYTSHLKAQKGAGV